MRTEVYLIRVPKGEKKKKKEKIFKDIMCINFPNLTKNINS